MRSLFSRSSFAVAAAGLSLLAACADPIAAPVTPDVEASAVVVGSFPAPVGALSQTLVSNGTVKYCGVLTTPEGPFPTGQATTAATFPGPAAACATFATDLTGPLAAYNPGWTAPLAGTSWIGVTVAGPTDYGAVNVPSNYYAALPGARSFKVDFNVASGTPTLELEVLADNDVLVYLNDQLIGRHVAIPDDNSQNFNNSLLIDGRRVSDGQSAFVAGANTLRFDVIGTRIKNVGGNAQPCVPNQTGGPANGQQVAPGVPITPANAGTYNQTDCRNPTGLDFKARVYLASLGNQGCSLGYWKNKGVKDGYPDDPNEAGVTGPTTVMNTIFTFPGAPAAVVAKGNQTLHQALSSGGGGLNALGRQAAAAYLNSLAVNYPLTTAQVIAQVNAALASGNYGDLAEQLDEYNNLHNARRCPD